MQFEEFDKKIKEASEHYHPAYDETAWKKMNNLLNVQLPEKTDGWRRIYFLLLLLIFVTGAGYLLVEKPWNSNNKINTATNNITSKSNETTNTFISPEDKTSGNNKTVGKIPEQVGVSGLVSEKQSSFIPQTGNKPAGKDIISFNKKYKIPSPIFKNKVNAGRTEDKNIISKNQDKTPGVRVGNKSDLAQQKQGDLGGDNSDNKNDVSKSINDDSQQPVEPLEGIPPVKTKNNKQKSFISNLGLTISAGPDISSVGSSEPGKTTLYYGAGLRYDITKRFTVRTGFYITNKIYTAAGKDYKLTYNAYPTFTLTSVNADCKIFEVPLVVNYNFIQRKKNNLFGTIGVSSFFMNKESYRYHYNDQMGQYRYGSKIYSNQHQHYFSIVTLAAGYERKLNRMISMTAEPYVKLPLSGVGEGKIKLNSAGLLVSVSVKPFAAKEQKK